MRIWIFDLIILTFRAKFLYLWILQLRSFQFWNKEFHSEELMLYAMHYAVQSNFVFIYFCFCVKLLVVWYFCIDHKTRERTKWCRRVENHNVLFTRAYTAHIYISTEMKLRKTSMYNNHYIKIFHSIVFECAVWLYRFSDFKNHDLRCFFHQVIVAHIHRLPMVKSRRK